MTLPLFLVFGLLAALAVFFVAWPIIRIRSESRRARLALAGTLALLLLGIGIGSYIMLGEPRLAARSLESDDTVIARGLDALQSGQTQGNADLNGLITLLVRKLRTNTSDERGWTMLGRAYLTAGDPDDAAKSFARAIAIARANGRADPVLFSAYGEALVRSSSGAVSPEAEAAFNAALAADPKDKAARYYLGLANAERGDTAKAIALWQSLLDEAPANAPYRAELVDRIAMLNAQRGATPDISAMVEGLAARLKAKPDDLDGWRRLLRAYVVLGKIPQAREALAGARKALAGQPAALAALEGDAKDLKLAN